MNTELIAVFRGTPMDAEIVKDILETNRIAVNLKNEYMGYIAPWHVASGGFEPAEIDVFRKDKEKALELIEEFKHSH